MHINIYELLLKGNCTKIDSRAISNTNSCHCIIIYSLTKKNTAAFENELYN